MVVFYKIVSLFNFNTVYNMEFLLEAVMDQDGFGNHKRAVGQIKGSMCIRQALHEPYHVIAEIPDQSSEKTGKGL
jgi:hypothetical protein